MIINYLAFVLDEHSRVRLLKDTEPSFPEVLCHHMTLVNDIAQPGFADIVVNTLNSKLGMGVITPILVTGYAKGLGIECFSCTHDRQAVRSDGSFYHITLSKERGIRSAASNQLQKNVTLWRGIFPVYGRYEILQREE